MALPYGHSKDLKIFQKVTITLVFGVQKNLQILTMVEGGSHI